MGLLKTHTTIKETTDVKSVTINDSPTRLIASLFLSGSMIASSYLPVATIANNELMEMNNASNPKSSGGNKRVKIGSANSGIICAMVFPETRVRVFLIYSDLRMRFHI
jgi:hypothetical protein